MTELEDLAKRERCSTSRAAFGLGLPSRTCAIPTTFPSSAIRTGSTPTAFSWASRAFSRPCAPGSARTNLQGPGRGITEGRTREGEPREGEPREREEESRRSPRGPFDALRALKEDMRKRDEAAPNKETAAAPPRAHARDRARRRRAGHASPLRRGPAARPTRARLPKQAIERPRDLERALQASRGRGARRRGRRARAPAHARRGARALRGGGRRRAGRRAGESTCPSTRCAVAPGSAADRRADRPARQQRTSGAREPRALSTDDASARRAVRARDPRQGGTLARRRRRPARARLRRGCRRARRASMSRRFATATSGDGGEGAVYVCYDADPGSRAYPFGLSSFSDGEKRYKDADSKPRRHVAAMSVN